MEVIHTGIWVSDMAAARAFFVDAMGLTQRSSFTHDGVENVFVGGAHAQVQLRHDQDRPAPTPDRSDYDHLAVSVDDADEESERIADETGCAVIDGPRTVESNDVRIAFLEGPDGYVIELVERLD